MMMYLSHLRVESSFRHTQSNAVSPAIRTAVIVHRKEVVKHQRNGVYDRIGAATGVSFEEHRLAGDTVPPMHPDRWWARAVGGTALQSTAKSSCIGHFSGMCFFWDLVCYAPTQVATQLPQRRIQVVCSNKVARKRLTESNGTPAMDFGCEEIHKRRYTQTKNRTKHTINSDVGELMCRV